MFASTTNFSTRLLSGVAIALFGILASCSASNDSGQSEEVSMVTDTFQTDVPDTMTKNRIIQRDIVLSDTTFLERELSSEFYHAVYIEKNRKNKRYKWLMDFSYDEYDQQTYDAVRKDIEESHPGSLTKHELFGLPTNWIPVYLYKGKFYIYAPSEWGAVGKRILTPEAFVRWYMDGPYPQPITSVTKKDDRTYDVNLLADESRGGQPEKLIIHIINPEKKLFIAEFPQETPDDRYRLYVSADRARDFDMIVNYCATGKQMEYEFPKMNFDSLIKSVK